MSDLDNPASRCAEQAAAYCRSVLELLGTRDPLEVLGETEFLIDRLRRGLTPEQQGRREGPGKWSYRHVFCHLADNEVVWAFRLRMVLAQDRPTLAGYDQDLWAERLRYGDADPDEAAREFAVIRRSNLRLLAAAAPEDLLRAGIHAERGEESVRQMMQLYAGHDLIHLRQLERIRRAVAVETH